ncbi:MAG: glycosyltransferase [Albidovulum sp.]
MFRRVYGVFQRYLARHLHLSRRGPVLRDAAGTVLADVEEIRLSANRIRVLCRSDLDELWLEDALGFQTRLLPEPADNTGAGPRLAASVSLHCGTLRLFAPICGAVSVDLPVPGRSRQRWAAIRLVPGFIIALIRAVPSILQWSRSGDLSLRPKIRKALGLTLDPQVAKIDKALFDRTGKVASVAPDTRIAIVLPVFNAFDLLPEVMDRIVRHTDLPWHLIIVEDASSDPRVRPWLRGCVANASGGQMVLIENQTNLGFIGSVNRGFAVAKDKAGIVVLLNSDALVPANWASRLVRPIVNNPHVASVTPMSNDAEILTVPVICAPQPLRAGQGDAIDRVAATFNPDACHENIPTGVGFCMAIAGQWLARVPEFDPVFGRGYGEEVDWCQKILALGGTHVALPGLFVEHRGGASFGSAEKQRLIATNNRIIGARHPRFPIVTETFILEDPLATPRLALAIAWAATRTKGRLPVYVAHSLGGGAEIWLERQIARATAAPDPEAALVLRLGGRFRWRLELYLPDDATLVGETDDLAVTAALLAPAHCDFVYSCAVGDPDPFSVPRLLAGLKRDGDGMEILFHDFFPLSPSYTLLDADGRFRGVPLAGNDDPAHQTTTPGGETVSLDDWRVAWGKLFDVADRLTVFSDDSRNHVARAWPEFAGKIRVVPHALHTAVAAIGVPQTGRDVVIGVLGNINFQKGIAIVAALAEAAEGRPRIVVIGDTDPGYFLPASVRVHGAYALADLPTLARSYNIGAWLIPSIWPETFSYTTHEALATGLPVVGFALGAQAEALRDHPNGHLVESGEHETTVQALLMALRGILALQK